MEDAEGVEVERRGGAVTAVVMAAATTARPVCTNVADAPLRGEKEAEPGTDRGGGTMVRATAIPDAMAHGGNVFLAASAASTGAPPARGNTDADSGVAPTRRRWGATTLGPGRCRSQR